MAFEIYQDNPTPVCMARVYERCLTDSPFVCVSDDEDASDSGLGSPLSELEQFLNFPDQSSEVHSRRHRSSRRRLFTNKRQRTQSSDDTDSSEEDVSRPRKRLRRHAQFALEFTFPSREITDKLTETLHDNEDCISDGSRIFSLPVVKENQCGTKCIDHSVVADVVRGKYKDIGERHIIDCRYPYEYNGGHVKGAINIYTQEGADRFLQNINSQANKDDEKRVIIFYSETCVRSSQIFGYFRDADRKLNSNRYPHLYCPEVYLLEGGYSSFFEHQKKLCNPRHIIQMLDPRHNKDLRHFRSNEQRKIKELKRERIGKLQSLCQSPEF